MRVKVNDFDLQKTIQAGQIFNYFSENGYYYLIHRNSVIKIRQIDARELEFFSYPKKNDLKSLRRLFDLDADYSKIMKRYFYNKKIERSYGKYSGVRIMKLDPWECLVGFICSQMNNIPRIRKMVSCICRKFGKRVRFDGKDFYLFPSAEKIASLSERDLSECKMGYRATYLLHAGKAVSAGFDLNKLKSLEYAEAKRGLMMLLGIGEKVADCVLLFSLGFTEAFPVDVWIKRIMEKIYFKGKISEKKIADFARKKFKRDAGIVHEFLYANRSEFQ